MKRVFSSQYPYHPSTKSKLQELLGFPLQLGSSKPKHLEDPEVLNRSRGLPKPLKRGVLRAYETFLSAFATRQLSDLEGLGEYNFLKHLAVNMCKFQSYTMKIVGSLEDSDVMLLKRHILTGAVLPYRNLNFPKGYYEEHDISLFAKKLSTHYKFQGKVPVKSFAEFGTTDLKQLNELSDVTPYGETLEKLFCLLNRHPMCLAVMDVGVYTSLKLNVLDAQGNVVGGGTDPQEKEFHCMRLESVGKVNSWANRLIHWRSGFLTFLNTQFPGLLDQFTITDIDGCMAGNPLIK